MSKIQLRAYILLFVMLMAILMNIGYREEHEFMKEIDGRFDELVKDVTRRWTRFSR